VIDAKCARCGQTSKIQANLGEAQPLQEGCLPFPAENRLKCPNCSAEIDLSEARRQLEAQVKKPVIVQEAE
jgi:DNA-directed RNA polymerase subunit RPC12/RpoP